MSTETIATILSAATLLLSFAAAFGWMINRTDKQSAETRRDLGERISAVEQRIGGVERELVEVKIALARIEGPPRHLMPAR